MLDLLLAAASAATPFAHTVPVADPPRPPNIVVVLADDLGYGDLGCYGHPTIETPRLDRLAAEGLRFTQFYTASSVCSPSRAALLTGRLPVRSGLCGHARRDVMRPGNAGGLDDGEITLAEALRARGYRTAAIGKWHLGHMPDALPLRHGFDRFFGMPWSNDMRPFYLIEGAERVPGEVDQRALTERLTDEAIRFVCECRDEPFFLYLAHAIPHTPHFPSEAQAGRSARGAYGDVLADLDRSTGRLLDELDVLGLGADTLFFFTSDNGPWLERGLDGGSAGLLRDGKGSTFEGGMRVPAIARWPAGIPSGRVTAELATTMDLFATCVMLAGGELPDDRPLDSHDLTAVLRGSGGTTRDCVHFYRGAELYALRCGAWKAHFITRSAYGSDPPVIHDPPLLFQLAEDPSERYDLAATAPVIGALLVDVARRHQLACAPAPSVIDARVPATTLPLASGEDRAAAAGWGTGTWYDQHAALCRIGRERPVEVVFLGDSITQGFGREGIGGAGAATWARHCAPLAAANFGLSGDRTEHVLWRIEHGAFEHARPKLVVLHIGTNNLPQDSAADTAAGVEAVVARLLEELPEARVLLLGVFPRGALASDPLRAKGRAVNEALAPLGARERVTYRDLAPVFLLPDGGVDLDLMADDALHLRSAGYAAWWEAISDDVRRLLAQD